MRKTILTILGTALGLVTGYFRGFIDDAVGRVVDAFLALPLVIIALLALVALGTSNTTVVVVIGVVFAPIIARTVRAAVLSERELDYVAAAQLRGENAHAQGVKYSGDWDDKVRNCFNYKAFH